MSELREKIALEIHAGVPDFTEMHTCREVADEILALIQKEQAGTQREAFNAGYSYGIEAEASPEEYDAAWQLYQQSGRTPPQGEDG